MLRFLVRRSLTGLAVLLVASFLYYVAIAAVIDPLEDLRFTTDPNQEQLIAERVALLDLDTPSQIRYLSWLGAFVTGDLGSSFRTGQAVTTILQGAVVSTVQLLTVATVVAILLGVSIGIASALRQYTAFDYSITFSAFLFFSLPIFWVAVLLKQWGAIGFNNFLGDPFFGLVVLALAGLAAGTFWMLAVGGSPPRRLAVFVAGAASAVGVLLLLQLTGWWSTPHINPSLLAPLGVLTAVVITALSTGLGHRRALGASLTVVALGVLAWVLLTPFQLWNPVTAVMSYPLLVGLGALSAVVGAGVGYAWGGPDKGQAARTAAIVAVFMALYLGLDRMMQAWPAYSEALNGRPIATIGDATPGLGGNFWIGAIDAYTHLVLPTIVLLLISFASYTRYSRGSMLETLNQDYMRTARAKGLNERTVVMRHGFRNTLIPLATIVPVDIITLLGGALITERIFNRPGMGTVFLRGLDEGDIDPIMAYLIIVGALAIIANIAADVIYTVLDPRIRVDT
ncbi:ABC transporter permease [Pseudokineococcus sp. 1T1Z-3]|uniref:ABC transporter permease n=1 Tax=Pseudokineococcus sp. 1T1Z-3 TaxID=3132745 RepID=UPI0030AFFD35